MAIKTKKRDAAIASAVTALVLTAVLTGLAACQNSITGVDLDSEIQTLVTGPTTGSGYGGVSNLVLPHFTTVAGGYTGPATITYYAPAATLDVNINAAGKLEYTSGTAPTGSVEKITLTGPSVTPGNEEILIGREPLGQDNQIVLNIVSNGDLAFRVDGSNKLIGSYAEFQLINTAAGALGSSGNYKLEANLDLMGGVSGVPDWEPVGTTGSAFTGAFDGGGHTLSNLLINKSGVDNVGLFGDASGTIKNLGIASGSVTGGNNTGGVAGNLSGGSITACYNKASVTGTGSVGGVAGNLSGNITACYNTAEVTGGSNVGGVAGNLSGNITACYNTGKVVSSRGGGGVAGQNNGTITNCYYLASPEGKGVGGSDDKPGQWESFSDETAFTPTGTDWASGSNWNISTPPPKLKWE